MTNRNIKGRLLFWPSKLPSGATYIPLSIELEVKPTRWQRFKLWLIGVKWIDDKTTL